MVNRAEQHGEAMLLTPERNQYKYLLNKCNHNEKLKQYGWIYGWNGW